MAGRERSCDSTADTHPVCLTDRCLFGRLRPGCGSLRQPGGYCGGVLAPELLLAFTPYLVLGLAQRVRGGGGHNLMLGAESFDICFR